jgi:hypothetical protein
VNRIVNEHFPHFADVDDNNELVPTLTAAVSFGALS